MLLLNTTNVERLFNKVWRKIRARAVHPRLNLHHIRLAGLAAKAIYDLECKVLDCKNKMHDKGFRFL